MHRLKAYRLMEKFRKSLTEQLDKYVLSGWLIEDLKLLPPQQRISFVYRLLPYMLARVSSPMEEDRVGAVQSRELEEYKRRIIELANTLNTPKY